MKRLRLIVTVLLIVILGCDTSFNPKGPFRKQLVVYAILSTETDTTFARVYKTYDPPGFDPYEVTTDQPVTDAVVRLTSGGSEWVFGDTLVPRADTSRYQSDIAAYVLSTAALSSTTWGYLVRLFLIGEAWEAGAWRQFEREVPLSILEVIDCQTFISEYPRLQRREGSRSFEEHLQVFENNAYRWTIVSLRDGRDVDSVRFLRAEFEFLETDPHLYSYYNIASGFRDEFTLRTDEPDYSNIRDGRGIFGAFVRQRVVFNVPSDLGGSLSCQ
jgi:hypothetical protein